MSARPETLAADPVTARQFRVERREARVQLPEDARDPRHVSFFRRPQGALIVTLDRLLHHRQRHAHDARGAHPLRTRNRDERRDTGKSGGKLLENYRGVHQHRSVVENEGRRLQERIDFREGVDVSEEGNGFVLESYFGGNQRHRDTADVRRIEHANQLHCRSFGWRPESAAPWGG